VRCVKPNSRQDPTIFDAGKVTHQIKVLGLMETIKMRQHGFPIRKSFLQFYQR
jgi:myosin heavy subunit